MIVNEELRKNGRNLFRNFVSESEERLEGCSRSPVQESNARSSQYEVQFVFMLGPYKCIFAPCQLAQWVHGRREEDPLSVGATWTASAT